MRLTHPGRGLAILASSILTFSAGAVAMAAPAAAATSDTRITVVESADSIPVGGTVVMTVEMTNDGPDTAETAGVIVFLGGPIASVTADSGCTAAGTAEVICGDFDLGVGMSRSFDISITSNAPGTITSDFRTYGDSTDPAPTNNRVDEQTTVSDPSTDLGIAINDDLDPVTVGDEVTYTATVSNNGPEDADDVVATFNLDGVDFTYGNLDTSQGNCFFFLGGLIECELGTISDGDDATVTIRATPSATGTLTTDGDVEAAQDDPNPANNADTEDTTVIDPKADVSVNLGASAGLLASAINYTLTLGNSGPDTVSSATATVQLPTATTSVANLPTGCSYTTSTDTVTCTVGTIANGSSAVRTFRANLGLLSLGPLPATATRTASSPTDPNAANDTDSADCTAVTSLLITCS